MQTFPLERTWKLALADLGVSTGRLLQRAELPGDLLTRSRPTVTAEQYFRLWDALVELIGRPHFGLEVSQMLSAEMFDPPLFAGLLSPDLDTAVDRIRTYKRLVGPCRMSVDRHDEGLELTLRPVGRLAFPEQYAVAEAAFWVRFARMATRVEVRPLGVGLPFALDDPAPSTAYFGLPVERSEQVTVRFSLLDARRPFVTHDEGMWAFFEPELRRRLAEVADDASMAERVRASLLELLPTGRSGMGDVARSLGVSSRTLQRRLQQETTRFQDVLAATRSELARYYLAESEMGGAEISFLLGYDDPNSFIRAFHQWTGHSPEAMRAQLRA